MRADWIRADKFKPNEVGCYLVTTANGKVTIDRFDGEGWGKCQPRANVKKDSRYKPHIAWTFLPPIAKIEDVQ